ncbi:MAG: hypothetical protein ACRDOB_07000 [Streptosporangiaceae bacterium]
MAEQPRQEDYGQPGQVISSPAPDAWAPTGPYGGGTPGQAPYGGTPGQAPYGGPGGKSPGQDEFGDTFMGLDNFRETMTAGPAYAEPAPAAPARPDPAYPDPTAQLPAYAQPGYAEPGYPQPGYPQPGYPQPGYGGPAQPGGGGRPGSAGRGPGQRNKIIVITVAVIAFLAAGGGAYALVAHHSHGSAAAPPTQSASIPATQSASTGPTAATTAPPTSASASASSGSTVAVAAGAASNAAAPPVTTFLNSYFTAINAHDYAAYDSLLDQQLQPYTQSEFDSGYGTTTDSNETLTSITDTGSGGEAASVTFTSHQQPADSPDNSSCDQWSISLFLVPNGSGYLEGKAPSTYHASYQAC